MSNPNPQEDLTALLTKQIQAVEDVKKFVENNNDLFNQLNESLKTANEPEFNKQKEILIKKLEEFQKSTPTAIAEMSKQIDSLEERKLTTEEQKKLFTELKDKKDSFQTNFNRNIQKKINELNNFNFSRDQKDYKAKLNILQNNDDIEKELKDLKDNLNNFNDSTKNLSNDIKKAGNTILSNAVGVTGDLLGAKLTGMNSISGAITAITGLSTTISSVKNIFSMFTGAVSSLHSDLILMEGITKNELAYHDEWMQYYVKQGLKIKNDQYEFLNNLEEMKEKFSTDSGIGSSFKDLNDQLTIADNRLKSLDINSTKARLYGEIGDNLIRKRINETAEIIQAMGPFADLMAKSVTNNVKESNEMLSDYYYKAKKLMGLSEDDILKLTTRAVSLGKSFPTVFHDLSKATKEAADKFNLDFKRMSKDVITLRNDIKNFAHKSAEDLATSVAQIRRLGVSTEDAMSIFNKFNTFEDTATTAAQLSQSFGMVIDSMELLKAESPDEMLQMYKDAFIASGKSFETMNRFERSLLLDQTGLSEQAAQALFSAQNAGKTYEEVMSDIESQNVTLDQAQQMEKMDGSIQKTYKTMKDFKDITSLTNDIMEKQLLTSEKSAAAFTKVSDNIEKLQSSLLNAGNSLEKYGDSAQKFIVDNSQRLQKTTGQMQKKAKQNLELGIKAADAAISGDNQKFEDNVNQLKKNKKIEAKLKTQFTEQNIADVAKPIIQTAPVAAKVIENDIKEKKPNPTDGLITALANVLTEDEMTKLSNAGIGLASTTTQQVTDAIKRKLNDAKDTNLKDQLRSILNKINNNQSESVIIPTEQEKGNNVNTEQNNVVTPTTPTSNVPQGASLTPIKQIESDKTTQALKVKIEELSQQVASLQQGKSEGKVVGNSVTKVGIYVDSKELGHVMLQGNFIGMAADQSMAGVYPLLKADVIQTRDGQLMQNYGNSSV